MIRKLANEIMDWLHPPICLGCDQQFAQAPGLCEQCQTKLASKKIGFCLGCGLPVPVPLAAVAKCRLCHGKAPHFDRLVVMGEYKDFLRQLVLKGKSKSGELLMEVLGHLIAKSKKDLFKGLGKVEVTAIPSPWVRTLIRGHNPAASLASGLAAGLGVRLNLGLLRRARSTVRQAGLPKQGRQMAIHGAFKKGNRTAAETILLVDDVMTTGATLKEAAKVLKAGGIGKIVPVILARTP
jgi:predicted amidophosphoribosyltransferase